MNGCGLHGCLEAVEAINGEIVPVGRFIPSSLNAVQVSSRQFQVFHPLSPSACVLAYHETYNVHVSMLKRRLGSTRRLLRSARSYTGSSRSCPGLACAFEFSVRT